MELPKSDIAWDAVQRVHLPNISAQAYVSETDKHTLAAIQKIPFLPQVVRKFHELALDRISYAQNSAESVRCGPKQFKTIHKMLQEACSVLSITEPEIYIKQSEVFNAYTSGTNRTFIVLHSALVDHFTDDELLFVIGHECGHIKAGHVLYQELGRMLIPVIDAIGQATMGIGQLAGLGLVAAFYEWMRQAEISCDRAGLLVSQNARGSLAGLMKLGGVSVRYQNEANLDAFLEQARTHAATTGLEGLSKAFLFIMYNWQLTHPQVVYRAKALDEWITDGSYQKVLDGDYPRDMMGATQLGQLMKCPNCKKQVSGGLAFCPNCGQDLHPERNGGNMNVGSECVRCHTPLAPGTKFCPVCGMAAGQGGQPQQGGYPPQPQGYYPQQGGYPPQQQQQQGYYPPQQGGYPPQQGGYPPPPPGAYGPQNVPDIAPQGYGQQPNGFPTTGGSYEAQTVFPPQPDYPMQQQPSMEPPPVIVPNAPQGNAMLDTARQGLDNAAQGITNAWKAAENMVKPSTPPSPQQWQQAPPPQLAPQGQQQYQQPAAPPPVYYPQQQEQAPPTPPQTLAYLETPPEDEHVAEANLESGTTSEEKAEEAK